MEWEGLNMAYNPEQCINPIWNIHCYKTAENLILEILSYSSDFKKHLVKVTPG